ncbi:MAG: histidinol-phosphate transaminase [Bacteroidales bacterium]
MLKIMNIIPEEIKNLEPYKSAREDFNKKGLLFLDANENPCGERYNRYPDPLQHKLKNQLSKTTGTPAEKLFLGNGSDEIIDLVIRTFCRPGIDNLITIEPSYGMYEVLASINRVETKKVPLNKNFQLVPDELLSEVDDKTKLIILCSPNNPSGNLLKFSDIEKILQSFTGIILLDEAYIEFSGSEGFKGKITEYPNLILMRTLSKAWGMAGIRLGYAMCDPEIVQILSKVKYPYNINSITQKKAMQVLKKPQRKQKTVKHINKEKQKVVKILRDLNCIEKIYSSDANFILVKTKNYRDIIHFLKERGIIIRDRSNLKHCEDCVRITIGTKSQNNKLLKQMKQFEKLKT